MTSNDTFLGEVSDVLTREGIESYTGGSPSHFQPTDDEIDQIIDDAQPVIIALLEARGYTLDGDDIYGPADDLDDWRNFSLDEKENSLLLEVIDASCVTIVDGGATRRIRQAVDIAWRDAEEAAFASLATLTSVLAEQAPEHALALVPDSLRPLLCSALEEMIESAPEHPRGRGEVHVLEDLRDSLS